MSVVPKPKPVPVKLAPAGAVKGPGVKCPGVAPPKAPVPGRANTSNPFADPPPPGQMALVNDGGKLVPVKREARFENKHVICEQTNKCCS